MQAFTCMSSGEKFWVSVHGWIADCGLRITDFAASGPTAIADLRLSEGCGEGRNGACVLAGPNR
jgi:hypothetical protein